MQRAWLLLFLGACSTPAPARTGTPAPTPMRSLASLVALDARQLWSPELEPNPEPVLGTTCSQADAALTRSAAVLARALDAGGPALTASRVERALRDQGAPYVWPHAWSLSGANLRPLLESRLRAWLGSFDEGGQRRCGLFVLQRPTGGQIAVAIAVDAWADLQPLPSQVRTSAWVEVKASLLTTSPEAKVIVLGPRGAPKPLPTSLRGREVRARFMADQPGIWTIQVLAELPGGPRQVLEAELRAGAADEALSGAAEVPSRPEELPNDPSAALLARLNAARASEGLRPLRQDPRLAELAESQARALLNRRRVAHDVGTGDPAERVAAAGIATNGVGENVAHANGVDEVHRALWSSPSHRSNILSDRFDSIGIGVVVDGESLWVCELFARLSN